MNSSSNIAYMFDAGALSPGYEAAAAGLQVGGRCLPGVPRKPQQQGIELQTTLREEYTKF